MELKHGVVTFESTHHAIKGEKILKENEIEHRMIPTPRAITRSCGLSAKFDLKDMEEIKELFSQGEIALTGIYRYISSSNVEKVEE